MTNYQLDFSKLTIGDLIPVLSANPTKADILILSHKVIVGGIFHLPPIEIDPIVELVCSEFAAWMASVEFMKMVGK